MLIHLSGIDCIKRQIVVAGEDAFIMRYDYIDNITLDEWAKWKKTRVMVMVSESNMDK